MKETLPNTIKKRLSDIGFADKEGADAPFFVLGSFADNTLPVDVYGPHREGLIDKTIAAVNQPARIENTLYKVHAVKDINSLRVKGKSIFKHSMTFIFKLEQIQEAD